MVPLLYPDPIEKEVKKWKFLFLNHQCIFEEHIPKYLCLFLRERLSSKSWSVFVEGSMGLKGAAF